MANFTPVAGLIGGALIGIAATLLLWMNGRIAGVSGIFSGLLPPASSAEGSWRALFLAGLVGGVGAYIVFLEPNSRITIQASIPLLIVGGLIVGASTRVGGGCTSGHGVCGIGRLSRRSFVGTATFMASAIVTTFIVRHVIGG